MYYIIYVSQAHRPMSEAELSEILAKSRERNTGDGITGLLIYKFTPQDDRGNFMQILEGDKAAVLAAYERIAADTRHHTKIVLEEGTIDGRNFPDWSMGFRNVEARDLKSFDGFSDLGETGFWERAKAGQVHDALETMKAFYEDAALDE